MSEPVTASTVLPASSVLQILNCREGGKIDVHSRTNGLARQYKVVREDGTSGAVLVWSGRNVMDSQNLMGAFQDNSRGKFRSIKGNRHFQVAEPCTQVSFETSGRSADDAKAVLVINGSLTTGESAKEFFAAAQAEEGGATLGQTFGAIPGVIAKIFLQSIQGGVIGGCYLFSDAQSVDDYLASDTWASAKADTPWENVSVEKYTVLDDEPAPSA